MAHILIFLTTTPTFMIDKRIKLHDKSFRVLIPAEKIDKAVARVAEQLDERYKGKTPIFLGVLNGSFLFLSDLIRKVSFDNELAFVKISSYEGTDSTGCVKQQLGVDIDIEGRDIIIVEDIVETGHSMAYLLDYLKPMNPASISICTLFFKPEKFLYEYKIDYTALSIGNEFIVGYGLDYNQLGRNLKDIYVIDE
jgi:hypoxanthine phosphoribosyltransferase